MTDVQGSLIVGRLLVDGDNDGLRTDLLTLGQRLAVRFDVTASVELVPEWALSRLGDASEREAGGIAHDHRGRRCGGRAVHGEFAVGVEVALPGCRCEHDRAGHGVPEEFGRCIHGVGIDAPTSDQLYPVERVAVAIQSEFRFGSVGGVVVGRERNIGAEQWLKVEHVSYFVKTHEPSVGTQGPWVALRMQQR